MKHPFDSDGKKILLHVGAGSSPPEKLPKIFLDYHEVRLDIDPRCKPDLVSSMTNMKLVNDNSVDAIWCSHALEHLANHEVQPTLLEWQRVLKSDGYALMTMPDLKQAAKMIVDGRLNDVIYESPVGSVTPLDIVFGHSKSIEDGNASMQHKTGFTEKRINSALELAQFHQLKVWKKGLNIWAIAAKSKHSNVVNELYGKKSNFLSIGYH